MKEMLGGCCVCADENGWSDNPLIYCDGPNCEVAVHQGCYGIQEVPDGEWFCAKCSASSSNGGGGYTNGVAGPTPNTNGVQPSFQTKKIRCELCPSGYGALKRTEKNGWAHVICALYIPEVRFGDVHTMDPVILSDVPVDRFEKLCYICENEMGRSQAKMGACMSCNKLGCKRGFHVTCAQQKGLLCEEGGASKNVKYCGYCEHHLRKAQQDPSIKVIPACPPTKLPPTTTTTYTNGHSHHSHHNGHHNGHQHVTSSTAFTPPPSSNNSTHNHMLADPLPRSEVNSVLGFPSSSSTTGSGTSSTAGHDDGITASAATNASGSNSTNHPPSAFSTNFSPPLSNSSRSSVALDTTPPMSAPTPSSSSASASTSNHLISSTSETTTVGAHLQQLQQQAAAAAAAAAALAASNGVHHVNGNAAINFNQVVNAVAMGQTEALVGGRLLPSSIANIGADFHLNGGENLEEKTVKAVLTGAPLAGAKGKRNRDHKDIAGMEKNSTKRPRTNNRAGAGANNSGSSAAVNANKNQMQRLYNLVAPVVSETVSDFQRDRVADRTASERRAAAAAAAASVNGTGPSTSGSGTATSNGDAVHLSHHFLNGPLVQQQQPLQIPATSGRPVVSNSTLPSSMEALLERQWEQGSQFMMSQAHFDVAQLLQCLHQLKSENIRLEDQLALQTKRREHLTALNQRLTQPLAPPLRHDGQQQQPQQYQNPSTSVLSPHHSPQVSLPNPTNLVGLNEESLNQLRTMVAAGVAQQTSSRPPPTLNQPTTAAAVTTSSAASNGPSAFTTQRTATPSTIAAPPTTTSQIDLSNLSPERLAQMNLYRNQSLLDPSIIMMLQNPSYLSAAANGNMLRLMSPQLANAMAAITAAQQQHQQQQQQQQNTTTAANGK